MMWTYSQSKATLSCLPAKFYSGNGAGKNNTDMQNVKDVGPIPQGKYKVVALIDHDPKLGVYVLKLEPDPSNNMFGRDAFYFHGDNPAHPGQSSDGCIVGPYWARVTVWSSPDHDIEVVA